MSVLVVGLSHKGTPLTMLERTALTGDALAKLLHDVARADDIAGALILSTCNRTEIYAEAGSFHGAVAAICDLLSRHSGVPHDELTACLYVHYADRAVQHMLTVACGLDSMVVGESQILGQLRAALRIAREQGTLGRPLADLGSLALRAGKRAQTETGVGGAGASLVSVGLQAAVSQLAGLQDGKRVPSGLAGQHVLVIGAGAMSALAAASVSRAGAAGLVIANRTRKHADRLAAQHGGKTGPMSDLPGLMAAADLVVTCTGAPGHVITADMVRAAMTGRDRPLVLVDLALPRDIEPGVGDLPGVAVTDLETLAAAEPEGCRPGEAEIAAAQQVVTQELEAYLVAGRAARVAPTVVALRAKAASVVESELARLAGRLGGADAVVLEEVARSMNRVADKLLHAPTVRVKELAGSPAADSYEDALRVLFDLDPAVVQAVAQADPLLAPPPAGPARAAQPAAQGKVRQAAGEGRTAGDGDANAGEGR
ncbi:MAG TPA: glutamyl-tRNA reductase [Streptosporangiaceae bacterium]|nr:glutamyl-tRNA reductase [Streptosporangiaceae bacterium]